MARAKNMPAGMLCLTGKRMSCNVVGWLMRRAVLNGILTLFIQLSIPLENLTSVVKEKQLFLVL